MKNLLLELNWRTLYNLDNSRPEYTWSDWFVGIMTFLLVIPWIGGKVFSKSPWKFDNKK